LFSWHTYAQCSQSALSVEKARIHRQCRYAAERDDPRNDDEPVLDTSAMDDCLKRPYVYLAEYGLCDIRGWACTERKDEYRTDFCEANKNTVPHPKVCEPAMQQQQQIQPKDDGKKD
jgi:hypothetical protein